MRRFRFYLVLLIVLGATAGWLLASPGFFGRLPRANFLASVLPAVLVDLTNGERTAAALPPLAVNPLLTRAAEAKAADMAARDYFSHLDPVTGASPWRWLDEVGYAYVFAGENLAVNFTDSPDIVRAWANSPSHYANLVAAGFNEIGVGVARGRYQGRESVFVVQFFGRPAAGNLFLAGPAAVAAAGPDFPRFRLWLARLFLFGRQPEMISQPAATSYLAFPATSY